MKTSVGEQAIVVGAGVAGLATAASLAPFFDRVIVLDRDRPPEGRQPRRFVPQGKHLHGLLGGGLAALCDLFPGFEQDLQEHQAVRLQEGTDVWVETVSGETLPRFDYGVTRYALSRGLLESLIHDRVRALANVELRYRTGVQRLMAEETGKFVVGVTVDDADSREQFLPGQLVVDCSGASASLTTKLLRAAGYETPAEDRIEVNVCYATMVVELPQPLPQGWKGLVTAPRPPTICRGCILMPLEGGRQFIVSVAGIGGDTPPAERDALGKYMEGLATPTLSRLLREAQVQGSIERFRFQHDRWRHFEALRAFPRGLLVAGDAICLLNPALGQGMTVALQEAVAMRQLLLQRVAERDPLDGLAFPYFRRVAEILEGPWTQVSVSDLAYPTTIGARTRESETTRLVMGVLSDMSGRDAELLKLECQVRNLLKPFGAIRSSPAWQQALKQIGSLPGWK